jgi:hypothetical protein
MCTLGRERRGKYEREGEKGVSDNGGNEVVVPNGNPRWEPLIADT